MNDRNYRLDFLKTTFDYINSDLKFAEAKNTFLATFNLAIIGASISFLYKESVISRLSKCVFIIFCLFILISTAISAFSHLPVTIQCLSKKA